MYLVSTDFGQIVSVSRNLAFTHAVFTPDSGSAAGSVEVFDPESGKLIQIYGSGNSSVSFGASRHSYSCAGSVYTISGGMAANSGGLNVTAAHRLQKELFGEVCGVNEFCRICKDHRQHLHRC